MSRSLTRTTGARLAMAAAVVTAITASPAVADAASTCTYNPESKTVVVDDHSGIGKQLRILRVGEQIRIADTDTFNPQPTTGTFCVGGPLQVATVTNTNHISVFSNISQLGDLVQADGFVIDQRDGFLGPGATPEHDGASEIEVSINTASTPSKLVVIGTKTSDPVTQGNDEIRTGQAGQTNLGYAGATDIDQDVDITLDTPPAVVGLIGLDGNDLLSGHGNEITQTPRDATATLELGGGDGRDLMIGGLGQDALTGGTGDDRFFSVDGRADSILDESGDDTAEFDKSDFVVNGIEHKFVESPVGKLELSPAVVRARAGSPVRLKLAWKHPEGWRQLRSLELRAVDVKGKTLATIAVDPARGRASAHGALKALSASTVGHRAKTAWARLLLRPVKSLAGRELRLEVQATDIHGRTQLEPLAGRLTVRN